MHIKKFRPGLNACPCGGYVGKWRNSLYREGKNPVLLGRDYFVECLDCERSTAHARTMARALYLWNTNQAEIGRRRRADESRVYGRAETRPII